MHDMQAEAGTPLTHAPTPSTVRPRRRTVVVLGLAAGWVVLDQLTKVWAERALTQGEPVQVVGDLLRWHLTYNSGAAFSMGTSLTPVITVVGTVISVVVVSMAFRVRSLPWAVALGLLLGGAVGNQIDRYLREPGPLFGHVVDFIRLPNFAIFNVADIGVTSAAVLIGILALRGLRLDGTREGQEP